ncbi:MAG: VCBS repeat-containing protein [Verrucomicrobia bacterium]|nr:VCBS repeat-containing protein [Verrucomicrobiota bacterium]
MDLNGDGFPDILSGSYSRNGQPMAGLFQVLWGQKGGTFKKASVLNGTDGKPLEIPFKGENEMTEAICTRPFAVDWNGDGKLDLVVGTFSGSFYVFYGEGGGKFRPKPERIMAGGRPLTVDGHHGDPFVVDWDGDGDLDLITGSDHGGVLWAENVAGKGKPPELKPFRPLIPANTTFQYGQLLAENDLTGPVSSMRIWVEDVNGDGKLDILVGDNVTLISTANGVSKAEFAKRHAKWQESIQAASRELGSSSGGNNQKAMERYQKVYEERTAFMHEERTGYIWLYVRK